MSELIKNRKIRSLESLFLVKGKVNDVFYTTKKDKDITALASNYLKRVCTERLVTIGGSMTETITKTITKVTILSNKKD